MGRGIWGFSNAIVLGFCELPLGFAERAGGDFSIVLCKQPVRGRKGTLQSSDGGEGSLAAEEAHYMLL